MNKPQAVVPAKKATTKRSNPAPKAAKADTPKSTLPAPVPLPMTVNQEILHYLQLEGVSHIFQIPGAAFMYMLDDLATVQDKFMTVICKHESGAAYMADGFYRVTGKLGVVMTTSGPGATNAVTGVMNANNDGSGVLLLTGEIAQQYYGLGFLQEGIDTALNVDAVYTAATSYSALIQEPFEASTIIKTALRNAMGLPRRSVHLSLPANVGPMPIPNVFPLATNHSQYRMSKNRVADFEVLPILIELSRAKRPVIFLGNGCRYISEKAHQYLVDIAEYYGVPIMTTPDGKGIFPESHEMSLRVFGCANTIWPYYWLNAPKGEDPFDFILVLGSSLGGLATYLFSPYLMPKNGAFYQVDVQADKLGRAYPMKMAVVGETGSFINCMHNMMGQAGTAAKKPEVVKRKAILKKIKQTYSPFQDPAQYVSNATPIKPAALMRCLQESLDKKRETHIFVDAGNCVGWCNHYLVVERPWNIYSSLSMGPMGFAVAAVVGGKMGKPTSVSLAVVGDGAFLMHGSEVSTAAHYKVGAIWIVLNDNNLRMVSQGMEHFFPNVKPQVYDKLYQLGGSDLRKVAEGYGAQTYEVRTTAEAKAAITAAVKDADKNKRPQVIIANISFAEEPPYYNPLYNPPTPAAAPPAKKTK